MGNSICCCFTPDTSDPEYIDGFPRNDNYYTAHIKSYEATEIWPFF